jgi:hypothetical protein
MITQLHNQKIFVILVYVPHKADGHHLETLENRINLINAVISTQQKLHGSHLDILIAGDFNRHLHLWGGNHGFARHNRGDEAAPIIDLMADHNLQSLLPRGTITFENPQGRSTIDLTIASKFRDSLKYPDIEALRSFPLSLSKLLNRERRQGAVCVVVWT